MRSPAVGVVVQWSPDRSESEEAAEKVEPFRAARPVGAKGLDPDAPAGPPEHEPADDQIIDRAVIVTLEGDDPARSFGQVMAARDAFTTCSSSLSRRSTVST